MQTDQPWLSLADCFKTCDSTAGPGQGVPVQCTQGHQPGGWACVFTPGQLLGCSCVPGATRGTGPRLPQLTRPSRQPQWGGHLHFCHSADVDEDGDSGRPRILLAVPSLAGTSSGQGSTPAWPAPRPPQRACLSCFSISSAPAVVPAAGKDVTMCRKLGSRPRQLGTRDSNTAAPGPSDAGAAPNHRFLEAAYI